MIQAEGLTKFYGRHPAVQGLTFDAEAGEILGFLGPNGAGKTTTMRIRAGYMPPTSGSARVAGFDVVDQSLDVRRRVGYLPETVPLYPEMSVSEYLTFMGSLRRVPHLAERGRERTVLLSTHILSEAQQVCDRVLIINRGQIVAEDTPANLQAQLAGGERLRVQAALGTREQIALLPKAP